MGKYLLQNKKAEQNSRFPAALLHDFLFLCPSTGRKNVWQATGFTQFLLHAVAVFYHCVSQKVKGGFFLFSRVSA
jgi:hypothetical protein